MYHYLQFRLVVLVIQREVTVCFTDSPVGSYTTSWAYYWVEYMWTKDRWAW